MDSMAFFKCIQAGALSGAYYLYGDEPYSRGNAVRQAMATVDGAARELNVQVLKNPLPADAVNACETLPFFSDKRLVVIKEISADTALALATYVEGTPETTILLIDYSGKPDARNSLFLTLGAHKRTVEFARFEPERAVGFVEKRARENGVGIEHSAARRLVEWVGVDLATLENTLLRLSGYVGQGGAITLETVTACVPPSTEYSVFVILDSLVAGNKRDAVKRISGMVESGADTSRRLAAFLEGRMRQMVTAKRLLQLGANDQAVIKALGGSPYAAKKTVQNAKKCTLRQLVSALTDFGTVEWKQTQGLLSDDDALLLAVMKNF